ncbi:MAG TPA: hypothetical protein VEL47_04120 [Myxococcota bacterium]|nr:hypothetical protein [Myxococcota bacterium]
MKCKRLMLFNAIFLSFYVTASDIGESGSQDQEAFIKAVQEKDAKAALNLAMKHDHLHQASPANILFVLFAAVEFEKVKEFYAEPYLLNQDANRIEEGRERIGARLARMVRDLPNSEGEALRRHVVETFVFGDLHSLSTFTNMLQTRQFPKLSDTFFDDEYLLKIFVESSNYGYLNMSIEIRQEHGLSRPPCEVDCEVNKKNFIAIALCCARALKKEKAAKFLEKHL